MLQNRIGHGLHVLLVAAAVALVVVAAVDHSWLAVVSASLAGVSLAVGFLANRRAARARSGADRAP